ncbi:hypothetical protein ACO3VM_05255 [Methanocaldococcus sp. 10A]
MHTTIVSTNAKKKAENIIRKYMKIERNSSSFVTLRSLCSLRDRK